MKQKQLLIILGAAGIILWIYSIYSSIPFAKHLNFNFLKLCCLPYFEFEF